MEEPTPPTYEDQAVKDAEFLVHARARGEFTEIPAGYEPWTKNRKKLASKEHRLQAALDYAVSTLYDMAIWPPEAKWDANDERCHENFRRITGLGS